MNESGVPPEGFPRGFPVTGWETPENLINWLAARVARRGGSMTRNERQQLLDAFRGCEFEELKFELYFMLLGIGGRNNAREDAQHRRELARRLRGG